MKTIEKSVLIWFSAREMFDLIVDVPAYPQFLPWCDKAEILSQTDDGMTARISLRLPEALKTAIDAAAAREGLSANTWLVRELKRAVQRGSARKSFGSGLTGFAEN